MTYLKQARIRSPSGLSTRNAATFVNEAKRFNSEITVTIHGKSANGKSLFKLQSLDLHRGVMVNIYAIGEDEQAACRRLAALMEEFK
ncbi:hypothetical protein CYY_004249 [Polysphondylium violaceum]|uniref:Phosphocarrier protein HPr n=1 Tax=Polysphondylium violaceum TaxID=133409 RepID=A0A8J4UT49_9MYCE|nr:hypothetical protein CYY_004249 [Polysphondylium violaceum]